MRFHLWLALMSVLVIATPGEGAPPEPAIDDTHRLDIAANTRVAVHVYSQVADLSADDQRISLDVAREAFSTASVNVVWTLCEPGVCVTPSAEALKLRIVLSTDRDESHSRVLGQEDRQH